MSEESYDDWVARLKLDNEANRRSLEDTAKATDPLYGLGPGDLLMWKQQYGDHAFNEAMEEHRFTKKFIEIEKRKIEEADRANTLLELSGRYRRLNDPDSELSKAVQSLLRQDPGLSLKAAIRLVLIDHPEYQL